METLTLKKPNRIPFYQLQTICSLMQSIDIETYGELETNVKFGGVNERLECCEFEIECDITVMSERVPTGIKAETDPRSVLCTSKEVFNVKLFREEDEIILPWREKEFLKNTIKNNLIII